MISVRMRKLGLDVRAVAGSDLAGEDDRSVFRAAIQEGRILVTYNVVDFAPLYGDALNEGLPIPGLVFVNVASIPTSDARGLSEALAALAGKIERGEVDPAGGLFLQRKR